MAGPAVVYPGLLYVTLCLSTVQSSINFTSIARGNVAGAIVSASASKLLGVFLTPLLAIALMNSTGNADVGIGAIGDLVLQILLPFVLDQLSRRWTADFVERHARLKLFDQGSIVLIVFAAFSQGSREEGTWSMVGRVDLMTIVVVSVALLSFVLWLIWFTARRLRSTAPTPSPSRWAAPRSPSPPGCRWRRCCSLASRSACSCCR